MRVIGSGGEVKGLVSRSDVQGIPAIDPAQGDLAAGEQRPEQHAGGFGARQQALRLDPPLELLVQTRECRNFRVWAITQGTEGGPYGTTEATEHSRRTPGPIAGRRRSAGGAGGHGRLAGGAEEGAG